MLSSEKLLRKLLKANADTGHADSRTRGHRCRGRVGLEAWRGATPLHLAVEVEPEEDAAGRCVGTSHTHA